MKKFLFPIFATFLSLFLASPLNAYTDIEESSDYETAISWLTEQGAISGYSDGSFKPENKITRAEFLKILVFLKEGKTPETPEETCFTDVDLEEWYAPYVCFGKENNIVNGYENGEFKPNQKINVVEASKIIVEALDLETVEHVQGTDWYSTYLETLSGLGTYPDELKYLNESLSRNEVAEMLWRIAEEKTNEPSTSWDAFSSDCTFFEYDIPENIDVKRIEETWLSWMNATRETQGLPAYTYNDQLMRSATEWAVYGKSRGYMDHKRPGTSAYYDYYAIQDWFANLGLTFSNQGGYTFTENIGRGPYSCSTEDCTDELLEAIWYTYDYYLNEAGSSYSPHWNSLVNNQFQEVGFGITVDSSSYYLTVHYATEITSDPAPLCDAL